MFKTPRLASIIYPACTWKIAADEKVVYLTFDDGPIPDVTEFVLDTLDKFGAEATFFCIGDNVRKYPANAAEIVRRGHSVGNHTFNHLNGWKNSTADYLANVQKCQSELLENGIVTSLFRPPYGRISRAQIASLKPDYQLIMWSVLTKDYNAAISREASLSQTLGAIRPGSIVVMHDSLKAAATMKFILPKILRNLTGRGYKFAKLKMVL